MKNDKAFTLIELVGVIVILSLILVVVGPSIIERIKKTETRISNASLALIESAVDLYIDENFNSYPNINGNTYCISLQQLVDSGKLKKIFLNSKLGTEIALDTLIEVEIINNNMNTIINNSCVEYIIRPLYTNSVLKGMDPKLTTGMIAVLYDGTNWVKASLYEEWYNYTAKEWANVVLINNEKRAIYQDADDGTEILEEDVLAYLVWIPRYKYKLFNVEALKLPVRTIEIEFENENTIKSTGISNEEWLTHPAFTFGDKDLNGFWVGKFETTGTEVMPTIKPGISSLRDQHTNIQFATSQKFSNTTNYGLTTENDSHMMKNTEWGAVAYLTGSIYGKSTELWPNPSNDFLTGCAGNSISAKNLNGCPNSYTTANGQEASTTGNVYGIYDMSGGANEQVMGVMYNSDNITIMTGQSGFDQAFIDSPSMSKYIDKYGYGEDQHNQSSYNRRILGDATGETRNWYGEYCGIVNDFCPWFIRSGNNSTTHTIFYATVNSTSTGSAHEYDSFRVIILGSN